MRRAPLIPTIFVAAAVAVMIGLGVWQLQRAEWKERLLARAASRVKLPVLDLDPLVRSPGGKPLPDSLAFRRVRITCYFVGLPPKVQAGRSEAGASGYSYVLPCFWDEQYSWADRIRMNVGWSSRPAVQLPSRREGMTFEGQVGVVEDGKPIILTAANALPPLERSAPPSPDTIPNNHQLYALQWFFFAAAAAAIYLLALRRRARG